MGNVFPMTAPNTTAATGSPVKLLTYAGVPLNALVAYERAALDLPHNVMQLQVRATQQLQAAMQRQLSVNPKTTAESAASVKAGIAESVFAKACLCPSLGTDHNPQVYSGQPYVDGVPVWVQEVAQQWNTSSERHRQSVGHNRGNATNIPCAFPSSGWRPEQQAAWANGTAQLLRDFVSTQKLSRALLHVRKALKSHGHRATTASSSSPPLIFVEVMRSYDALVKSIACGRAVPSSSSSSPSSVTAGWLVSPGMWCGLLCQFFRSLPEPLMPALCSRRLEPLLSHAANLPSSGMEGRDTPGSSLLPPHQVAAVKVLLESFASLSTVDYVTFCFVLDLVYQHRTELTGDEVEALADAMLRESAVPHVVRAVAHACKPEAHMFWPVAGKTKCVLNNTVQHIDSFNPTDIETAGGMAAATVKHASSKECNKKLSNAVEASATETQHLVKSPPAAAAATTATEGKVTSNPAPAQTKSASGGYVGMAPPSQENEVTESASTSSGSEITSSLECCNHKNQPDEFSVLEENETHSSASKNKKWGEHSPPLGQRAAGENATRSCAGGQVMQWHDSSSSYSSSSNEGSKQDNDNDSGNFEVGPLKNLTGNAALSKVSLARALARASDATSASARVAPVTVNANVTASFAKQSTGQNLGTSIAESTPFEQLLPAQSNHTPPVTNFNVPPTTSGGVQVTLSRSTSTTTTTKNNASAAAVLADAPSLTGVSPVCKADLSLLSRHERELTAGNCDGNDNNDETHIPSALFSRSELMNSAQEIVATAGDGNAEKEGERDATLLPSALISQAEPTPLCPFNSQANSAFYPSAVEDPLGAENAVEALRRALQPFSDHPSSAPTSGSFPSRSPSSEGLTRSQNTKNCVSRGGETVGGAPKSPKADDVEVVAAPPCPLAQLPSSPAAGVLRTPRDELQRQQQLQQQEQETQQVQQQKGQHPQRGPSSTGKPPPNTAVAYRAQSAKPLQAALLEAKQRFLAEPVNSIPLFARTAVMDVEGSTFSSSQQNPPFNSADHGVQRNSKVQEDAARLRRVLACVQEQGWSFDDLLAAWKNAYSTSANTPAIAAETRSLVLPGRNGALRNSMRSPPNTNPPVPRGPLTDAHRLSSSTSASLLHLENTQELCKSSAWSTATPDSSTHVMEGKAGRSCLGGTEASLITPSPHEEDMHSCSGHERHTAAKNGTKQVGVGGKRTSANRSHHLPSSSLSTPAGTAFATTIPNASADDRGKVVPVDALSAMEKELQRLMEVVRALETSQYVQTRHAAAQTSELAARCAELQRQQREQAQQYRILQARLTDVSHELEDLKDDRARLQMQLTSARQEAVQLRDAIFPGKIRV